MHIHPAKTEQAAKYRIARGHTDTRNCFQGTLKCDEHARALRGRACCATAKLLTFFFPPQHKSLMHCLKPCRSNQWGLALKMAGKKIEVREVGVPDLYSPLLISA